jgi:cellulose synthase/poly-beta-1,6-N-acetylglucosamine synthase-like glycosyltransferase
LNDGYCIQSRFVLRGGIVVPAGAFILPGGVAGAAAAARDGAPGIGQRARLAVLIPAHNEQTVIGATLRTLMPTLPAKTRVVVVADNCTDGTAALARELGAEAIERHDASRRGKGFALDFGIRHLRKDPPDAVVFLDADCRVSPDTVRLLGAAAVGLQRPIQGLNLCDPDPNGSVLQIVSGLAFRFKNLIRALGLMRLAGMCHLTGTGMALPWPLVEKSKLADGNLVEDMQLGIEMALSGSSPLFLPEARVDSPLPQQQAAARTQRTRWEHGHLKTLLTQAPRILAIALRHSRRDIFWMALDLTIPPLSLLTMLLAAGALVTGVAHLLGASPLPAAILSLTCALMAFTILIGWAAYCRQQVPWQALLAAPFYAAAKLPIYAAFLIHKRTGWVRTNRDVPAV